VSTFEQDIAELKALHDAVLAERGRADHWLNMFAILLWKLAPAGSVHITDRDRAEFARLEERGDALLFTVGHGDSAEVSIVTAARAKTLRDYYDTTLRGTA
jgi:hypothetical protein